METLYSKKYYMENKNHLLAKYKRTCNYENELNMLVADFSNLPIDMRDKAITACKMVMAKKVASRAKSELQEKAKQIQMIKSGQATLGYTSKMQEVEEWHNLQEGFEFSCFMLSEFCRKYSVIE